MGILNDFKKLIFGAKAVTKHTADKAAEKLDDTKSDLLDKTEKMLDELSSEFSTSSRDEKTSVPTGKEDIWDKAKQKSARLVEDIQESEAYKKTAETLEKIGDSILDTGEVFYEKTKEVLEGPGKEMAEKAKEISEDIGEKIVSTGKDLMGKARGLADKLEHTFDETVKKAQAEAEAEKQKPKSEFADTPLDAGGSTLKDKDDFFDKASKYADGIYSDKPEILKEKATEGSNIGKQPIPGFEDKDQDGDELIDDAEIVDEDNPEKPE